MLLELFGITLTTAYHKKAHIHARARVCVYVCECVHVHVRTCVTLSSRFQDQIQLVFSQLL